MRRVLTLILVFITIGCAVKMTREESLVQLNIAEKARHQVFTNIEKEELIETAINAVLSLEDNYEFHHNPNGFVAERRWAIYAVLALAMGVDYLYFTVTESEEGLIVESKFVDGGSSSHGVGVGVDVGGGMSVTSSTGSYSGMVDFNYNQSPELYELFYSRINFILGNSREYLRCRDVKNSAKNGNGLFPLCYLPAESLPEYANQPQEVLDYYIELRKYERAQKEQDEGTIKPVAPIKPW